MKVKVLSSKSFCCSLLLSVLDTVLLTKVLANKTEKIFPASECSKDLLESLSKEVKFVKEVIACDVSPVAMFGIKRSQ